ncbi:FadD32-like long-chain-fatty-acid--AMP ligase [Corynebacterium sp. MC-17D]|uniref:Fatty acyl-AMP ligase n=1 Tax=Corynebacterium lipophilum TaxID=2804918 RepID=A0AAW5HWQ6_9CORY|nr:FadD32-like long-chain-fatty-acid--AMP ligase [Corynebacterium lipophilum]MCO6394933.1 fatty acyl-AMP ligase [Corynebacterium lipophilum]MCZ2117654.1 FadD32-like long-chain-fatty-acid--AMP ligase [Corynebacterium lipophilum]
MDLQVLIQRFIDETGQIKLPPNFTIPALTEMLYGAAAQAGATGTVNIRSWDYSADPDGALRTFTRAEVNTRIKSVAARLQQIGAPGDRVAILAGNCPEYIFGFMGAMYAGQIPVPLYDPTEPGHEGHLRAVLADAEANVVLTNKQGAPAVRAFFAELPGKERPRIIAVDALPDTLAAGWVAGQVEGDVDTSDHVSFLQYTSGSTRNPAGVMLTNESIVSNVIQIYTAAKLEQPMRVPCWLPLHHDMGIIISMMLIILGSEFELFTPRDFIQQPMRWVERLGRCESDPEDIHVFTAAPNFALELCARAVGHAPQDLDLSVLDALVIGSEPVTKPSVDSFIAAYEGFNLDRKAMRPSYGLAEATLLVSTPQTPERPKFVTLDRDKLTEGLAVETDGGVVMASNGQPVSWMHFAVVDPQTHDEVAPGTIGELWAHGPNIALGYQDRARDTADTFGNTIGATLQEGLPKDGWLATGDLGTLLDGHLYITGRVKDLIVVAGRNHYPQDIEATVMEASEHVRKDSVAAFAVPGEDVEKLVLLVERADTATPDGDADAIAAIRSAVTAKHGLAPADIRFYAPGEIARSSSGKIARQVNAKNYQG